MSSVNSTNTSSFYNIYGVRNSGIGGLASGLNTDEIVQSLTLGTRTKIGRQTQQKTMLQWQKTAYRSITNVLSTFQDKHLSSRGTDPIIMSNFWKTYKATSTSDKVSFISANTSGVGTVEIDKIQTLATRQTTIVDRTFTEDLVSEDVDLSSTQFYGKYLEIQVGDRAYKVRLDDMDNVPSLATPTYEDALQAILDREVGTYDLNGTDTSIIKVTIGPAASGNTGLFDIELESDVKTLRITSKSAELGFNVDQRNAFNLSTTLGEKYNLSGNDLTFSINGVELTATKDTTFNQLMSLVNSSGCGATLSFDNKLGQFVFTAQAYGSGNNIDIRDISGNLMNEFVGAATSSITSSVLSGAKLGYEAKIEGQARVDIDSLMSQIVASPPTITGDIVLDIEINDILYEIRIENSKIISAYDSAKDQYGGKTAAAWLQEQINQQISDKVGSEKVSMSFSLDKDTDTYDVTVLINGNTTVKLGLPPTGLASGDLDLLNPPAPASSVFGGAQVDNLGASTPLTDFFQPDASGAGEFYMTDRYGATKVIQWGGTSNVDTLRDLVEEMNKAYGATDRSFATIKNGRLVLDAGDGAIKIWEQKDGNDGNVLSVLFGDAMETQLNTNIPPGGTDDWLVFDGSPDPLKIDSASQQGQNAVIYVNGSTTPVVSHSNTFEVDGIAFEINAEHDKIADGGSITLTVRMDTDELVDKISAFVDEYNALIMTLNSVVNESKVHGYAPLTDEQRAEMTDEQIKAWEAEAKKGILYNDSTIRTIIDNLREQVNKKVNPSGISLYDIGITVKAYSSSSSGTGYDLSSAGVLEIDFTKLRNAIDTNPEAVRMVFTSSTSKYDKDEYKYNSDTGEYDRKAYFADQGVASALYEVINEAIASSSTSMGTLVALAGRDNSSIVDDTTVIGRKIARIDEYINTLKLRLQNEYERHWSKFSALETAIQRMSAQSSWLNEFYA